MQRKRQNSEFSPSPLKCCPAKCRSGRLPSRHPPSSRHWAGLVSDGQAIEDTFTARTITGRRQCNHTDKPASSAWVTAGRGTSPCI